VLYALQPLLWALLLAQHLALGMEEAGQLLPVSLAPWPRLAAQLPVWRADGQVIGFCQSLVLAVGVAGAAVLLRRLLLPTWRGWLAGTLLLLGLGVAGRWLVAA
jgi:hypothetical protein